MKNLFRVTALCMFLFSPAAANAEGSLSEAECKKLKKDILSVVKLRIANKDSNANFRSQETNKGSSFYPVANYNWAASALYVYETLCSKN